jgi:hypothetical protein
MLSEFFTDHGSVIFICVLFLLILSRVPFGNKSRRERPDPPVISGHIHGMYICYQCDTIFNTPRCPECGEEAVVPLVRLTGSIMENERITAVIGKLQGRSTRKLPTFQTFQDVEAATPAPRPEVANGGASEVPVSIAVIRPERSRELS